MLFSYQNTPMTLNGLKVCFLNNRRNPSYFRRPLINRKVLFALLLVRSFTHLSPIVPPLFLLLWRKNN